LKAASCSRKRAVNSGNTVKLSGKGNVVLNKHSGKGRYPAGKVRYLAQKLRCLAGKLLRYLTNR
jgi:hypothetical protein